MQKTREVEDPDTTLSQDGIFSDVPLEALELRGLWFARSLVLHFLPEPRTLREGGSVATTRSLQGLSPLEQVWGPPQAAGLQVGDGGS